MRPIVRRCSPVTLTALLALSLVVPHAAAAKDPGRKHSKELKADSKRAQIDEAAQEALERLFEKKPEAKELFEQSYGYAVFTNLKIAFGFSGGGGRGVAVDKKTGERTYMKMGTAGVGFGLGGQKYQVIFFFQTKEVFDDFVENGWQAEASAKAAAGTHGANVKTTFHNGIAVYQLTKKGLMANVDIAGTKYWKDPKLND